MFTRRHQQPQQTAPREDARTGAQTGYMAELDDWLDFTIFEPIDNTVASRRRQGTAHRFCRVQAALRAYKCWRDYQNGLKAQPAGKQKPFK